MTVPLRIGVMQLTMEPFEEILAHAQALDRHGFDTIWLAEAYPWWRKHSDGGPQLHRSLRADRPGDRTA